MVDHFDRDSDREPSSGAYGTERRWKWRYDSDGDHRVDASDDGAGYHDHDDAPHHYDNLSPHHYYNLSPHHDNQCAFFSRGVSRSHYGRAISK